MYNGGFTDKLLYTVLLGCYNLYIFSMQRFHVANFPTHEAKIKKLLSLTSPMIKITTSCCQFLNHEAKIKELLCLTSPP